MAERGIETETLSPRSSKLFTTPSLVTTTLTLAGVAEGHNSIFIVRLLKNRFVLIPGIQDRKGL